MLLLKMTIVPLFIAAVTLAGWRWGSRVAGVLGGLPVVAGPIVIFMAAEQGKHFGSQAAIAAISAIAGVMGFGIVYSWASERLPWPLALGSGLTAWLTIALCLSQFDFTLAFSLAIGCATLAMAPLLLPRKTAPLARASTLRSLPARMITGGLLTLSVTAIATNVGETWSGLLAAFPILSLVLAVFTHRAEGPAQVAQLFRGMVLGLYSFITFFLLLTVLWSHLEFWTTCATATAGSAAIQLIVQRLAKHFGFFRA